VPGKAASRIALHDPERGFETMQPMRIYHTTPDLSSATASPIRIAENRRVLMLPGLFATPKHD
jgi:hypothetical protein